MERLRIRRFESEGAISKALKNHNEQEAVVNMLLENTEFLAFLRKEFNRYLTNINFEDVKDKLRRVRQELKKLEDDLGAALVEMTDRIVELERK